MDFDEYSAEIARIQDELQRISDRTASQAIVNSANPDNPMFVELMERHAELIRLASELNERMIEQMKAGES